MILPKAEPFTWGRVLEIALLTVLLVLLAWVVGMFLGGWIASRAYGQEPIVAHYRYDGHWVLPDSVVTPGVVADSDVGVVCHRTTKALRHVTPAMHKAIFAEYRIDFATRAGYEDDHLISLELGGSNENANRWPQPYPQAHSKDSVENWVHRQICGGHLALRDVQVQIARDWVVLYRAMKGSQ